MSRPKLLEPTRRVLIPLFERDYARMQIMFPNKGVAPAVRALVRAFLNKVERRVAEETEPLLDEIELELEDV